MTTSHSFDREQVMAYLDGELKGSSVTEARAHLDACEECREMAAGFQKVSARLRTWRVEPAPDRLRNGVQIASASATTGAKMRPRPSWPAWTALAAAAIAGIAFLVNRPLLRSGPVPPQANTSGESALAATPRGEVLPTPAPPLTYHEQSFRITAFQGQQGQTSALPSGPMIVRTVRLQLSVDSLDDKRPQIEQLAAKHRGRISSLSLAGEGLTATIRVPSQNLDGLLASLRPLGKVRNESLSTDDVTADYQDLSIRVANAKREEQRLLELLANRTGKLSDVLEVEKSIARVRTDIERMEASLRSTKDRVDLSTVELVLERNYRAEVAIGDRPIGTRFRNAFIDGIRNAASSVVSAATVLVEVGPVIAVWALLLGWPVLWIVRRFKLRPLQQAR